MTAAAAANHACRWARVRSSMAIAVATFESTRYQRLSRSDSHRWAAARSSMATSVRGVAMPLQEPDRGIPARPRPRRGQLGDLGALHPQRFGDRRAAAARSCRAVAVERAKVEAVLAVVPVADLGGVRRQVGMVVAEHVARPHVALGVLDGGPALGEALGDVQPVGHDQAIRAAAYSSASA